MASSNVIAAASPQNSHAYSTNGRSLQARAMTRAAVSMLRGEKRENKMRGEKRENKKDFSKNRKQMRGKKGAAHFQFRSGILSRFSGARERGDKEVFK